MLFLKLGGLELFQLFSDVAGYRNMDAPVAVVPVNGDANLSCACPIGCDAVVLFDGLFKVKCMLIPNIFNAKIINH